MAKSIFALSRALSPEELITRRRTLVRLGLAWLVMMQVMMFALPGYLRQDSFTHDNLDVLDWAIFLLNWASLALTIPVILYAAWPIWLGTLSAIKQRHVTMDVPVAISMIAAFVPSVWATLQGHGEVYFDSVTMFVAFLLTARFFEMRARQSVDNAQHSKALELFCGPLIGQADRIAKWFVVIQLLIAVSVAGYWWMVEPSLALPIMVSLFVMSCPCALSLSAPVSLAATHATLAAYPDMSAAQTQRLFTGARRITRQNLYGSVIFHLITTPLAAVGLVTPWLAALAMFISSVAVAVNAWRLYREPPRRVAQDDARTYART